MDLPTVKENVIEIRSFIANNIKYDKIDRRGVLRNIFFRRPTNTIKYYFISSINLMTSSELFRDLVGIRIFAAIHRVQ